MTEGSFELEIEVAGTPEQVWQAIATGPGVTAWLQPTEIEETTGGRFAFDLQAQGTWNETGTVAEYDPPHRFATTGVRWKRSGSTPADTDDEAATLATQWIVEPTGGGTCIVRLVMSGFPDSGDWTDEVGGVRDGMRLALRALRAHLDPPPPTGGQPS